MGYPFTTAVGSLGFKVGQAEGPPPPGFSPAKLVFGALALASIGLSVYHGTKRNCGSVGWGLVWGFFGSIAPVVTPVIGFAQGFGQPLPECILRR